MKRKTKTESQERSYLVEELLGDPLLLHSAADEGGDEGSSERDVELDLGQVLEEVLNTGTDEWDKHTHTQRERDTRGAPLLEVGGGE